MLNRCFISFTSLCFLVILFDTRLLTTQQIMAFEEIKCKGGLGNYHVILKL